MCLQQPSAGRRAQGDGSGSSTSTSTSTGPMKAAPAPLLALLALLLTIRGPQTASSAPSAGGKDVFDEKDCSACQKNGTCSTCANDSQCPGTQKCCPGDCGYTCQEAIF
ncbi:hypothetical protein JD844_019409, partial [Phrynosoma platyrhinos]